MKVTKYCKWCGTSFLSERGIKYCSSYCKESMLKEQWKINKERRKMREKGTEEMVECPVCKSFFPLGKKYKYCSDACTFTARRKMKDEYDRIYNERERGA